MDFDLVIGTPENTVDMKSGLDTLQGASETTRIISEAVLTNNVPKRLSHANSIRTQLKQNFKGSYGQVFSIEIEDLQLRNKFEEIGPTVFSELYSYFISESLYLNTPELSLKASIIVEKMGDNAEELIDRLRSSALKKVHTVSEQFNHNVQIRYRKSEDEKIALATLNRETRVPLFHTEKKAPVSIKASITRLNINTGNGRLCVKGENETIPFSFGFKYKEVNIDAKKVFSANLDKNNGFDNDGWKYLSLLAEPIKLRNGKVIKYLIKGIE
ncbi:hypothetical protein [Aliivibrio fischeri]|uniref:hypothetical protein n=1 Tax=Aliivibrio fischeri TaxID=668 RepID=UPI0012DA9C1C|nr:hypothetical protein [Aliivibrio fischeri]